MDQQDTRQEQHTGEDASFPLSQVKNIAASKVSRGSRKKVSFSRVNHGRHAGLQNQLEQMHTQLEKERLQMKSAVENFPSGLLIFHLDEPKELCYANDCFCQMCGYTRNEMKEKYQNQYGPLIFDEDQALVEASLQELAEYPHQLNLYYRLKTKSQKVIWVLDSMKSVRDDQGRMWAYAAVLPMKNWNNPVFAAAAKEPFSLAAAEENAAETGPDDRNERKERERILEIIAEDSHKVILKYDFSSMRYEPINSIAKSLFQNIKEHTAQSLISGVYVAEESLNLAKQFHEEMCQGKKNGTMNFKVNRLDGGQRWYRSTFTNVFTDSNTPAYAVLFCEDITEQRAHQLASLRFSDYTKIGSRKIFLNLEYNVTEDSFEKSDGTIPPCYVSAFTASYTKAYQRMLDDVMPEDKTDFIACFSRENILKYTKDGTNYATKEILIHYDTEPTWIRVFYQTMKDPYTSSINIWLTCININEEKQYERKLLEMAKIDQITGIYNRPAFMDWVNDKYALVQGKEKRLLIMLDVDGFGKVNDRFGHHYGDTVLKKVAQTLKLVSGSEDILARLGGDEFAIFTGGFSDMDLAREKLRIIIASMYQELKWGVTISVSAGVSVFPDDGEEFQSLYEKADAALHHAKLTGRNKYVLYDPSMDDLQDGYDTGTESEEYFVTKGIYIRTFGYFEVFVNGEPLLIQNAKAKELLAILVDRRGAYVSQADLISCLWEEEPVNKVTMARLRKAVMHLRNALKAYGIEELVESKRGLRRLNVGLVTCDLYQFLSGKTKYSHLFKGSYLLNYSWGEMMISELEMQSSKG